MIRSLVAVVLAFTAACATDDPPDVYQCDSSEGPEGRFHMMRDTFEPLTLACAHRDETWDCIGMCCHPMETSVATTPETCTGMCVGLDEAACTANAACYVARDKDAFTAGTESFLGCYPLYIGSPETTPCAMRDVYTCANDGMCTGLYNQDSTGPKFAGCVAKSATMP